MLIPFQAASRHVTRRMAMPLVSQVVKFSASTGSYSSVNADEVAKFAAASHEWWDPKGQFGMLHLMNPVRMKYIRDVFLKYSRAGADPLVGGLARPLEGKKVLDVGCGGGLLSESLRRLGATVTGIDASSENVAMATHHASLDPMLKENLAYRSITVENLLQEVGASHFDMVCSLEVIEHVNNQDVFIRNCMDLVKPEGLAVFSTINRTPTSYLLTILMAEHILRWVPPGTHDHSTYVTPSELESFVRAAERSPHHPANCSLDIVDTRGIAYLPLENKWQVLDSSTAASKFPFGGDLDMNYVMTVVKRPFKESNAKPVETDVDPAANGVQRESLSGL
ncbi:Hexaprenyldihydroxybenzoate methyltransferase, mitochondrial [Chytriomyces hyalinus]|nr:Hexaprenyldihydroxybenzoate methyltransferase, mitochondrial [Chytriomyces hyalinus]